MPWSGSRTVYMKEKVYQVEAYRLQAVDTIINIKKYYSKKKE
jgi:hypothetical protein